MTQTPGTTDPIIGFADGYYVEWTGATAGGNDDGSTDEGETGGGNDNDTEEDFFPTQFTWPSVQVNIDDGNVEYAQSITGVVRSYRLTERESGNLTLTWQNVPYTLTQLSINSCGTGGTEGGGCVEGNWQDPNFENRYGGVFLFTEDTPVNKAAGEGSTCGTLGGGGGEDCAESGYTYAQVFDESELAYYLLNSGKSEGDIVGELIEGEPFVFEPVYEDVEDEYGQKAPIYPMDAVISFYPDDRDEVFVTYNISMRASVNGSNVQLRNGDITITHKITQDTDSDDFQEKLENILNLCNFPNPQDIEPQDFSHGYPVNYPYTIISEEEPTERFTNGYNCKIPDGPLEKGDVWYNPDTNERFYFDIVDIPDDVEVYTFTRNNGEIGRKVGRAYKTGTAIETIYEVPKSERCNPDANREIPYGLKVDITEVGNRGAIKGVKINNDERYPNIANYSDGDIVLLPGGNGNAKLRVIINEKTRWIKDYRTETFKGETIDGLTSS